MSAFRRLALLALVFAAVISLAFQVIPGPVATAAAIFSPQYAAETHTPFIHGAGPTDIVVSSQGFNNSPAGLLLQAEEGEEVELTFVYGDMLLHHDNPHRIVSAELGIDTGILDRTNSTVTVKFVARRSGTFVFSCVVMCDGHTNLVNGRLVVSPSALAPTTIKTALALNAPSQAPSGEKVILTAQVTDQAGKPVAGAPVRFHNHTTDFFVQTSMLVGASLTDAQGIARVEYTPKNAGNHVIHAVVASFEGDTRSAEAAAVSVVNVEDRGQVYRAQVGIRAPAGESSDAQALLAFPIPDLGQVLLFGILLSIWGTYLVVVFQVFQFQRDSWLVRLIPAGGMVLVFLLGTMLLVIVLRSPFTHLHLPQ